MFSLVAALIVQVYQPSLTVETCFLRTPPCASIFTHALANLQIAFGARCILTLGQLTDRPGLIGLHYKGFRD